MTGCSGCGPVALGLSTIAVIVAGPGTLRMIGAFTGVYASWWLLMIGVFVWFATAELRQVEAAHALAGATVGDHRPHRAARAGRHASAVTPQTGRGLPQPLRTAGVPRRRGAIPLSTKPGQGPCWPRPRPTTSLR